MRPKSVQENTNLKKKTYYKMGGVAKYFAAPSTYLETQHLITWAKAEKLPIAVLGFGSNSVFNDGPFEGLVICLENMRFHTWLNPNLLFVEAGLSNTEVAQLALEKNYIDLAWMHLMPGYLGASVRMNARCYGGETSQIVTGALVISSAGTLSWKEASDIFIGYKKTSLMDSPEIVLGCLIQLKQKSSQEEILAVMDKCKADRNRKDHFLYPSCGSTFKNNYDVGKPSGQVFDELKLKGTRVGHMEVSQTHANFIWNLGNGTTQDFLELTKRMKQKALREKQADLDLEVQPMGLYTKQQAQDLCFHRLGKTHPHPKGTWSGLFWHQSDAPHTKSESSPLLLAPYINYSRGTETASTVHTLEIQQTDHHLVWITHGSNEVFQAPSGRLTSGFCHNLWEQSGVCELFISHPTQPDLYMEIQINKDLAYYAAQFKTYRDKARKLVTSGIQVQKFAHKLVCSIPISLLTPYIDDNTMKIQGALSLNSGKSLFLAPHWNGQTAGETPDFHQTQRFWPVKVHPHEETAQPCPSRKP